MSMCEINNNIPKYVTVIIFKTLLIRSFELQQNRNIYIFKNQFCVKIPFYCYFFVFSNFTKSIENFQFRLPKSPN